MNPYAKMAGVAVTAFALIAGGVYTFSPRITDREAGLKIVRGQLVNAHVETGVKMDAILPHVEYIQLPLFLQKTRVSATEADEITIRTKEKARIYGAFEVQFTIDENDENFGNIYSELQADEISDLYPFIQNYTIPAAIDVYKEVATGSLNDNLTDLSEKLKARLQDILDSKGYTYINVKDVIPSGVGLSDKANDDLETIVSEERKLDLLKIQGQVADESIAITEKQAKVTAEALEVLREAGVPEDQLIQAYYLQLMRDNDKIGEPFVPGPIPGTGVGSVPVQKVTP